MSRAFVKEDVDPPERPRRPRAASGLPPGAVNYMTRRGAKQLRESVASLDKAQCTEVEQLLASATIVDPPEDRSRIAFGAKVLVEGATGERRAYEIVGADELDLFANAVSWISPIGKVLLAAEVGDRVTLPSGERVRVAAVEYPSD